MLAVALAALTVAVGVLAGWPGGESEAGKRRLSALAAVVAQNGTLVRGKGAVSSTNEENGIYTVIFKQDVSTCAFVAALGTHNGGVMNAGSAQAVNDTNSKAVDVRTFDGLTGANRPFHLHVIC
jgi:hypothetical protein